MPPTGPPIFCFRILRVLSTRGKLLVWQVTGPPALQVQVQVTSCVHCDARPWAARGRPVLRDRHRRAWPLGGTSFVPIFKRSCGTICNDVHCPNAVGGSRHIHVKHRAAGHRDWRRTRMRRRPGPVPAMSWPEPEARLDLRRTSATSHKVTHNQNQSNTSERFYSKKSTTKF
jgi:hypothetical protein